MLQRKNTQGQASEVPFHLQFLVDRFYLVLSVDLYGAGDPDLRFAAVVYQRVLDGLLADGTLRPALESSYAGLTEWQALQSFAYKCVQASDMGFYDGEIVVGLEHEDYETEVAYCIAHCDWTGASGDGLRVLQLWYREGFTAAWNRDVTYHPTTPSPYESPQEHRM